MRSDWFYCEMSIGNDIVDLKLNRNHHPRFEERAFTQSEQFWIRNSSCPEVDKWIAWAAKEAAYKLVKQKNAKVAFELKEFEWNFEHSYVSYNSDKYRAIVEVLFNHDGVLSSQPSGGTHCPRLAEALPCVHVVCLDQGQLELVETKVGLILDQQESSSVRQLAENLILNSPHYARWCERLGIASTERLLEHLVFRKINGKIPVAFLRDKEIPVNLSFSHDGAYAAVALKWKV